MGATWFSWPRPEGISFPDAYEFILPALTAMVDALRESEAVNINVPNADVEAMVRRQLSSIDLSHVTFHHIPTNECWCRDHGPIFVKRDSDQSIAIVDWDYNAWGWKYPPVDFDEDVPTRVGEVLGMEVFYPRIVMEGGSLDVNGTGTLLTTSACLLHPNRNPNLNKNQIEDKLRQYLGVRHFLWLGDGIVGDDTDGHIDDISRFVDRSTVVTVVEEDPSDPNYEPLQHNLSLLKEMQIEDGTPLHLLTLPMPSAVVKQDQRLPASYANFYIANKVVLLPVFNQPTDAWAAAVLQQAFPTRRIVPIDCRELIWGLGAFHCLSQQQPA
jgi:agmatine deiminase